MSSEGVLAMLTLDEELQAIWWYADLRGEEKRRRRAAYEQKWEAACEPEGLVRRLLHEAADFLRRASLDATVGRTDDGGIRLHAAGSRAPSADYDLSFEPSLEVGEITCTSSMRATPSFLGVDELLLNEEGVRTVIRLFVSDIAHRVHGLVISAASHVTAEQVNPAASVTAKQPVRRARGTNRAKPPKRQRKPVLR